MGDKSPKSKQRDKNQKTAATAQTKKAQDSRQTAFAAQGTKDKK